jgi:diguanylate cyclase (GGDEF)-like protein
VRNKGAFATYIEEMQKKLDEGAPDGDSFGIGVFDCDDLKTVNDRYGHDKGDIYLKTASSLICKVFQHSPVFRIGGDEFAVVLLNDDLRNREALVTAFEQSMAESRSSKENHWEQVHVAMGIAVFNPKLDHSVIDTVRRADKIMYTHKRQRKSADA